MIEYMMMERARSLSMWSLDSGWQQQRLITLCSLDSTIDPRVVHAWLTCQSLAVVSNPAERLCRPACL